MPVTWCYDVEDGQKYCNPGFPIGCLVARDGRPKDACVINVSYGFCPSTRTWPYFINWSACELILFLYSYNPLIGPNVII